MASHADVTFLFVVEGPRLQAQALLLASSLRRHHPDARLAAYLPASDGTPLPAAIAAMFEATGVTSHHLPKVEKLWKSPYPHGNKILALAAPRPSRWSVFLDTDMVALAPIDMADMPGPMQVSVIPEGIRSWSKNIADWEKAYAHFDMALPDERIRLLRGRRSSSPPYFNAGFVAVHEADQVEGKGFGRLWYETARNFDWRAKLRGKRPWLDQVTLPLTMKRFGFAAKIIDERNNCSISNERKLDGLSPAILHYHRAGFLRNWPGWQALVTPVLDNAPASHRDWIVANLTEAGYLGDLAEPAETEAH